MVSEIMAEESQKAPDNPVEKNGGGGVRQSVRKNDFVEISFTARVAGGEVFEKTAKPLLVVAGAGQVISGLDEALVGSPAGVQKSVKILKEKAFGERSQELVKLVPLAQFQQQGFTPFAGQELDVDGMRARVQSVAGGRVRVDFNPPLAGSDLEYEFTVEKIFTTPEEKIDALKRHLIDRLGGLTTEDREKLAGTSAEVRVSFDAAKGLVSLGVPDAFNKNTDYLVAKAHFVSQALGHVPEVKKVVVSEEFAKHEHVH